ncbi:MAG: hypothetical protein GY762_08485 [Proteobacteria bacterium]|nr:hypothetical protein [Pseudomonadota bacterium]
MPLSFARIRKTTRWSLIGIFTLTVFALGCTLSGPEDGRAPAIRSIVAQHALTRFDECSDFESYAKETAIQSMTAQIELARKWMYEEVDNRGDFGWFSKRGDDAVAVSEGGDVDADADGAMAPQSGSAEGNYTQTNTQEQGVDEADFIKTNGTHIYVASGLDLVVATVSDNGKLDEAGRLAIGGRPDEMFLYRDLVVVFSTLAEGDVPDDIKFARSTAYDSDPWYGTDVDAMEPMEDAFYCEPGMYCGGGGYTQIAAVDVSDPSSPTLVRTVTYAGSYVSSRMVNGSVRAVLSSPIQVFQVPTYVDWYEDMDELASVAKMKANAKFNALIKKNTDYINDVGLTDILPKKYGSNGDKVATTISECSDIYGPSTPAGLGLLSVISLDLNSPSLEQTALSVLGRRGLVYASTTSLYLTTATEYVFDAWRAGLWDAETSGIHKFDISSDPSTVTYKATGTATGRMLNQFCLGEHEGYLRIATTTGSAWGVPWENGNTLDNHILIFEEEAGDLKEISHLEGIGKEEEIYAARFIGDRGFLVTFFQTDPLFTFDLSDPYDPKVVGEWLGPGYSTYLHPYGADHLIAMGRDENWQATVTLYDVADFENPSMVERLPLTEGYDSAAVYEHKAFTFLAEQDVLSIPFDGWNYGVSQSRYMTGILLLGVDKTTGFDQTGQLIMRNSDTYEGRAQRSVVIDDVLYGISKCRITSASLSNPSSVLDSIPLFSGSSCEYGNYYW